MRKGLLTWIAGLGFVGAAAGLGWFIAVPEADRFWGLAAIVIGVVMVIAVWRADRSGDSSA